MNCCRCRRVALLALAIAVGSPAMAQGQAQYYNLDAGRPNRVEDAIATERLAVDVQLAPIRVERLLDGSYRWRSDPKLSMGILPFTELELRAPYILLRPRGSSSSSGFTSFGVGMLRTLNLESARLPAFAVSGEELFPAGVLAAPRASFSLKLLATKTSSLGRLHINAAAGTYSVRAAASADSACQAQPAKLLGLGGECGGAFIPDAPCEMAAGVAGRALVAHSLCMGTTAAQRTGGQAAAATPRTSGARWLAGVGFDRTFPLHAFLVSTDIVMERFRGLSPKSDVTMELGVRNQLTPQLLVDAGVARRFAGAVPSSSITVGMTYALVVRRAGRLATASAVADK
jgi:hypothetical protein